MQFTQGLHRAVQQKPDAVATSCNDRVRTFAETGDRVARLAAGFVGLGLTRESRICILALNSDRYLEAYLAIAWMGAISVPANCRWSNAELIYSINDADCTALIVDDQFSTAVPALREGCPGLREVIFAGDGPCPEGAIPCEALIGNSPGIDDVGAHGNDLLGIFYTGGTTGAPKGVMLSHSNICSSSLAMLAEGLFAEGARGLHIAPMFHLADMLMIGCLLLRGCEHVMLPHFKPDAVFSAIEERRVTDTLVVPAMLQALVDHPDIAKRDLGSLRNVLYGASPASEALIERATDALPGVGLMQGYGMTEVAAFLTALPREMHTPEGRKRNKLRSAGRAGYHVQLRVVDAEDREVPRGTIGEIIARGPNIMQGYLNKPEATGEALRNGWMHTGDLAYMDDDGYVFIVDRLKDMIISGGENVYSTEVENAIARHPAVASCAVVGIPCDEMGEKVHAAIVLKSGMSLTLDELREHCRTLIAGYKCPRSLVIVDALPLSGAGKILKTALRAPYWREVDRAAG
ncbi:MAG: long-chain-fatty-acid--CoA ligase [Novosphingobium sp.]|jgi:long-chain acyl-CoA synthetase|nr:long-chain-fatty-acid--CoA ligase [Novosphingobium sp.]